MSMSECHRLIHANANPFGFGARISREHYREPNTPTTLTQLVCVCLYFLKN